MSNFKENLYEKKVLFIRLARRIMQLAPIHLPE